MLIIALILRGYTWMIVIRVIYSFLDSWGLLSQEQGVIKSLIEISYEVTEPILKPMRKYFSIANFDMSPIILCILLEIIRMTLLSKFVL